MKSGNDETPDDTPQGARGVDRWPRYATLETGLREYWYPVMRSATLRRRPVSRGVAGYRIVFVRDKGRVFALEDVCPHRQIPLSKGDCVFPGHLTCIYHGWTFELESGKLAAALTDGPDSPIVGKVSVRTFPVAERCGLVWVWTGDKKPVPLEDDIPHDMLRPDSMIFHRVTEQVSNWRYAVENGFDEAHSKTLHRSSLWTFFKRLPAWHETEIVAEKGKDKDKVGDKDGTWLTRKPIAVHGVDDYPGLGSWPRFRFWQIRRKKAAPNIVSVRLPCTIRVAQAGAWGWHEYEWYVPIDRDHYRYFQIAVNWGGGLKRLGWWIRYWTYILWFHHHNFNNQDISMIRLMPYSHPERFFRPDISITSWRRLAEGARDFGPSEKDGREEAPITVSAE